MVASFPEFDYPKHRSSKGGCVPTEQKPNRLRSALHSKPPVDSSLLAKILSFHGSFIHSNRNLRKGAQRLPSFSASASKLKRTKSSSSASSADIQSDKSLTVGAQICESGSDFNKCNAAPKDSSSSANKIRRKWRSYKSSRAHSRMSGLEENASHLLQAACDPPSKRGVTEMGNLTSKISKACSLQSSVTSQLGDLGSQNSMFATSQCEVHDYAHTLKNTRCSAQPVDLISKQGNIGVQKPNSTVVGAQKPNSIDVGVECKPNSINVGAQKPNTIDVGVNCEPISINVGAQKSNSIDRGVKCANLSLVDGENELKNSNSAHQSKPASEACACNVIKLADATQPKENSQKIGSSAPLGAPNFSSENYPLYASDNSSNNMRWSSTSCASTDTSSSNSTRRSSCESRIPSAMPPATFLAKPHKAHDLAWAAIRSLQLRQGGAPLAITHFNLIRRVGHGDIGSVFLANLKDKLVASPLDATCLFAVKVMDKEALAQRNKLQRMHMEKEILECVDHPFLPTLYAHFDSDHFSCLVMDFCPGGDLYALRQKQPGKRFGLIAARFYAAEVLLALEYLHMLGIVYRDLKPENVLVREDGHIMLTDFDLSLKADVKPELVKHPLLSPASLSNSSSKRRLLRSYSQSSAVSSSLTTPFLDHESTTCRLPAACSIDPLISCLTLTNNSSKRAPQVLKGQSPIGYSMLSSKASKASHLHTLSHIDGSISEPLKISKQDVLCSDQSTPSKQDVPSSDSTPSTSNDLDGGESVRFAKIFLRSNTSRTHHRTQLSKESHDSPNASQSSTHKTQGAETETAMTYSLGCQEEDQLMFMELVAEPTQARSMSFVGTHEYLAPEIIAGYGHGSPVDWWTFGIFLYELLYGRSPFKGASNDQTLINIIRQSLRFPEMVGHADTEGMEDARSLIGGLLMKDPRRRLGCTKGAAEIKQHAFFKGVNWALIRCTQPPEVPSPCKKGMHAASNHHNHHHHHHSKSMHQFDFF